MEENSLSLYIKGVLFGYLANTFPTNTFSPISAL
ncbi:hypothetical protein FUAX_31660 [Fulvitalea axinellae]|uniref:Uncharacterized protein n=1 Tax=Fulvitalea axinellae TaxID=1182444 RepID=A0AAU9CW62_9BACT|nr:hypothetical protein FUAX_31660 [Fulvitalea axinellae]